MQNSKINIGQQSTLARLLAQENIHVIHGNYRTAWFDPEKRILALPVWKDRGKAVYDLLTGHEVGHALYTPAIGWHEAVTKVDGAPKAYLNILEDVRIERKIQDKYPGLRSSFKKAYSQLANEDFFGLSKIQDIRSLLLIDRINLKAKLTDNISIDFSPIEQEFLAKAYLTETFDDVVVLAKEIYNYQKSLYTEMQKSQKPSTDVMSNDSDSDYDKADPTENQDGETLEKQELGEGSEVEEKEEELEEEIQGNHRQSANKPDDQPQDESQNPVTEAKSQSPKDEDEEFLESVTDKAFREMEEELTASKDLNGAMVYTLNPLKQKDVIVDFKEYYAEWNKYLSELPEWHQDNLEFYKEKTLTGYNKFKHDTEAAAAYMAKEFELRKAAYQYSRSSVHKTGLINTNKLHAYKYSEDIFLKTTRLANYKNHGMMMFIDFSGSMQDSIGATIRQMLNLAAFCKMVNIPYEVYAFTTRINKMTQNPYDEMQDYKSYVDCEVIPHNFNLLNLMSSRMSRKQHQTSMHMLYNLSLAWDGEFSNAWINPWNHLYSTPLNTCIHYANDLIANFKQKHGIEKMTAMFLTDGESDSFQVRVTSDGDKFRTTESGRYSYRNSYLRVNNQTLNVGSINSSKVTEEMLKNLKNTTASTVLGFFISEYRNQAVAKVCNKTGYGNKEKYTDQLTKQRAIIENGVFGYDRYFGLCAKYMDVVEDEFGELVEDGASKNKLKTAFSKLTKQKRVNRIFLNAFVDSIA